MKTLLSIALYALLTSIAAGAGNANTILGNWVGNNYESLIIIDTIASFETSVDWHLFHYTLKGDSLELFVPYSKLGGGLPSVPTDTTSEDNLEPYHNSGFCFIIEHQDQDSMVLRPCRSSTRGQYRHAGEDGYLFDSTRTITLYFSFKDTLLSFDRLMFCKHSSERHEDGLTLVVPNKGKISFPPGKLIEMDLNIIVDSTKTIYVYGNKYGMQLLGLNKHSNNNALKQGYYQGCLNDSLYSRLIDLLKTSSLDRMRFKKDRNSLCFKKDTCDFYKLEYSLEIYYNNKYKRTDGNRFPAIGYSLFIYLLSIETEVPLVKSKTAKDMFKQFNKTLDK